MLTLSLITASYANLSLEMVKPTNVVYHINSVQADTGTTYIKDVPLRFYILSLYSGYKVDLKGVGDQNITLKNVPNDAYAILSALSAKYDITFTVNNKKHLITITQKK
jgi:hypothetical protein